MQVFGRFSPALIALTLAAMLGGCAVESYPGLSTSNDLEAPVLSSDQQKEVIRDLTAAQEKHRSEDGTDEQKVQ